MGNFFSIGWTVIGLVFSNQTKTALSWEVSDDLNGEFFSIRLDFDWTSFSNQAKTTLSWKGFFSQLLCLLVGVVFAKIMTRKKRLALHPLGAFSNKGRAPFVGGGSLDLVYSCVLWIQINTFRMKLSIKARVPFVGGGALDLDLVYSYERCEFKSIMQIICQMQINLILILNNRQFIDFKFHLL